MVDEKEIARRQKKWAASQAILETPDVDGRIKDAADAFGDAAAGALRDWVFQFGTARHWFESPLEAIFFAWWWAFEMARSSFSFDMFIGPKFCLVPQREVLCAGERFRLDFVVEPSGAEEYIANRPTPDFPKIAIELDGHDYHEKTREQVTARNRRDRLLQADGWVVFHVSGSELARNPADATRQIFDHCTAVLDSTPRKN